MREDVPASPVDSLTLRPWPAGARRTVAPMEVVALIHAVGGQQLAQIYRKFRALTIAESIAYDPIQVASTTLRSVGLNRALLLTIRCRHRSFKNISKRRQSCSTFSAKFADKIAQNNINEQ